MSDKEIIEKLRPILNELLDAMKEAKNPDSFMDGAIWSFKTIDKIEKEGN